MAKALITVEDGRILRFNNKAKIYKSFNEDGSIDFNLSKQRIFHKKIQDFADELTKFGNECEDYMDIVLQINQLIVAGEYQYDDYMELVELIIENFSSDDLGLVKYISSEVERTYSIDIEQGHNTDPNKNVLQFTNLYAKRIISAAIFARLTFPLICNFIYLTGSKKKEVPVFLEMMDRIFKVFNFDEHGQPIDLTAKIQKFVQINVDNSLYSDKVIWNYLSNQNITNQTLAQEIARDIFINIIPKLELNRSIVSFFHVVIKKKMEYQFTSKFKLSYKPIMRIITDDDSINPFVRIEQKLIKSNSELDIILQKLDVKNYIDNHNKLSVEEEEYHLKNIVIHTAQTRILGFFLCKVIGFGIPILSLNKREYIQILFCAKEWFENNGFSYISCIILGIPIERVKNSRKFGRVKQLIEIAESKVYIDLTKKYTEVGSKVNQDIIIEFIGSIINTDFDFYTMPDGTQYDVEPTNLKSVVFALLNFIETV